MVMIVVNVQASISIRPTGGLPDKPAGTVSANNIKIAFESFGNIEDEAIVMILGTGAQLTAWPDKF